MNILLTGGCGFIGSALVRHLLTETGHFVVNLDKLTYAAAPESLADLAGHSCYRFIRGDVCDRRLVREVLADYRIDTVMHLAAETHVDRAIADAAVFVQTNIVGSHVLLQAAADYWRWLPEYAPQQPCRRRFRFHHVSTDEVYGCLAAAEPAWREGAAYAPNNPYSASKAAADHLVRAYGKTYGLPILISHCTNNYGPGQHREKLIPLLIDNALAGRPLPLYGDGRQIRDWLFVSDHVRALRLLAESGRVGESYHIGGTGGVSNLVVAETVCRILERAAPDKPASVSAYRDLIRHVADRPGHDRRYALDSTKLTAELGWRPQVDLEAGLAQTVAWHLAQRAG